jgi:hypothetical protein
VTAAFGEQLEAELVDHARRFDPQQVGKLADRMKYCYDQDGALEQVTTREKNRQLSISARPDGSARLTGEATAELTELLLPMDAFPAPSPRWTGSQTRAPPGSAATTRCSRRSHSPCGPGSCPRWPVSPPRS